MTSSDESMTRMAAEYAANGFLMEPELITKGERTLLTHMQPTLVWLERTITVEAPPKDLPPALLSRCQELTTQLLGESTQLAFAQWYAKPPNAPDSLIDWHQDRAFWPASRPHSVTTWLSLDHADPDNGCLEFLSGSHRAEELLPHRLGRGELLTCRRAIPEQVQESAVQATTNRRDAVVYHERVIHRSGPNNSEQWRRALILGWNSAGI